MSQDDPVRWNADPNAPEGMGELLRSARNVAPTATQKAAVAAHLGLGGHVAWWALAAKGLAVAAVAGGGAWWAVAASGDQEASAPPAQSTPLEPGASSDSDGAPEAGSETDGVSLSPVGDVHDDAAAQSPTEAGASNSEQLGLAPSRASKPTARVPTTETVPEKGSAAHPPSEAQLLSAARRVVRDEPERALALLGQHERLYPSGVLAQEREVLRVRALKAGGKERAAAAREREFRAAHPDSVHSTE